MEIVIVAGFGGSGKTRMIKKMLSHNKGRSLVIVNDKGDEKYDTEVTDNSDIEICYIPQGCICCTLTIEFKAILDKIMNNLPDVLYLELAGTCLVQDVIRIMQEMNIVNGNNDNKLRIITMVSAEDCMYFIQYMGSFYTEQIESANEIMVTHISECSENEMADIIDELQELNQEAEIIKSAS